MINCFWIEYESLGCAVCWISSLECYRMLPKATRKWKSGDVGGVGSGSRRRREQAAPRNVTSVSYFFFALLNLTIPYTLAVWFSRIKTNKILLTPMGVLAPGSAHARPSAQPPITMSGNFPAHVSAESPSKFSKKNKKKLKIAPRGPGGGVRILFFPIIFIIFF